MKSSLIGDSGKGWVSPASWVSPGLETLHPVIHVFHSPQITPEERPPATLQPQIILTAEQSQLSCPAKQEIITVDEFPTALHGRPAAPQRVSVDLAPAFLSSAERVCTAPATGAEAGGGGKLCPQEIYTEM